MAATAKHELRQKFPTESTGEEDIAAIAKQISDHAEAIYQTWKSRGLAPTEILNCHSSSTAADKFGSVLTPVVAPAKNPPTAAELLAQAPTLDNNNLEKLVNNFVVEDKARLAASRQKSPSKSLPSSIQFALQKFERNTPQSSPVKSPASTLAKPQLQQRGASTTSSGAGNEAAPYANKPDITRPQTSTNTKLTSAHHSEMFLETIETTFPADLMPARIVVQQKRPTSTVLSCKVDHGSGSSLASAIAPTSSGLTTWPLKNKISTGEPKKRSPQDAKSPKIAKTPMSHNNGDGAATEPREGDDNNRASISVTREQPSCSVDSSTGTVSEADITAKGCLADEVAREEERLINALMTGAVIPEESLNRALNHSAAGRQKPAVKKEKPKVDPVKPIILSHSSNQASSATVASTAQAGEPIGSLSKEDLSTMSVVDYAKVRYKAAQQNPPAQKRLEEHQQPVTITTHNNNNNNNKNKNKNKNNKNNNTKNTNNNNNDNDSGNNNDDSNNSNNSSVHKNDNNDVKNHDSSHHYPHHHRHHHHHYHHLHRRNHTSSNNNSAPSNEAGGGGGGGGDDDDGGGGGGTTDNSDRLLVSATRTKFEPGLPDSRAEGTNIKTKETKGGRDIAGTSRWGPRVNSPCRPRLEQLVPHPELTTQQRQHIRAAATGTGNNPVRPFLTRGSVAERVLIFEKCPSELLLDKRGPRQPAINSWRTGHEVQSKAQIYARETTQLQKNLPPHTTLQRHVKANRNVFIPRFYFPGGKPIPTSQLDATFVRISAAFQSIPGHRAAKSQFDAITKACDCPLYWKVPLFLASGGDKNGYVDQNMFTKFWKEWSGTHHDAASRFVRMTTRGLKDHIIPEDLIPLVQDVVETHPGLTFLKEATEFHSRYVHTVVARIFYSVNRSWSGKISVAELRRSNLLAVISVLEHEEDINQVTAYFSYEHFYVIYCKFWELDRDHDLFIDKLDLTRHNDNALSTRMIERIFSGAVTRGGVRTSGALQQHRHPSPSGNQHPYGQHHVPDDHDEVDHLHGHQLRYQHDPHHHHHHHHEQQQQQQQQHEDNKMSYTEFVWFLLSEEDKNHPTAIEYWFRCMDLDGDGYLSMYELEYFYEEQLHRMEAIGIETLPFEDCLCQMLDMIHPTTPGKISLSDLKRCKTTSIFFDTFFNLEKYLDHEQRDPFASARDHDVDGHELSDWDRFAAEEYELLVAEESGNEPNEQILYESSAEDAQSPNQSALTRGSVEEDAATTDRIPAGEMQATVVRQELQTTRYDSDDSDDYADSEN